MKTILQTRMKYLRKKKNKDKNEVKYLSDDDLDELLKE